MVGLGRKLKRNRVWSLGLYVKAPEFSFHDDLGRADLVLNSRRLRSTRRHVHTQADPFLFPHGDWLYVFYESQAVGEPGKIEAMRTSDLKSFEPIGEVLKEPFHLSFPFVFEHRAEVYLLPESLSTNEVSLYRFAEFPSRVVKDRVLLKGGYKDSSLVEHNGSWYFFTTSADGLELFYTDDPRSGRFIPHRQNPLTHDPRYNQCGGSPIYLDGRLYRIAQDCSGEYGRNISILEIVELSKTAYREELVIRDYFPLNDEWNARGGHHLSVANFKGRTVVAVDGKQDDLWVNKVFSLIYRAAGR